MATIRKTHFAPKCISLSKPSNKPAFNLVHNFQFSLNQQPEKNCTAVHGFQPTNKIPWVYFPTNLVSIPHRDTTTIKGKLLSNQCFPNGDHTLAFLFCCCMWRQEAFLATFAKIWQQCIGLLLYHKASATLGSINHFRAVS